MVTAARWWESLRHNLNTVIRMNLHLLDHHPIRTRIAGGLLAVLALTPPLWAEISDFDFLNEYESAFQSVGTTAPAWNAKAGMGGSGGLVAGATGYIACVKTGQPLELKPGQSVVVAMNFLHKGQTARIAERNAGIFLSANPSASPLAAAEGALLAVFLYNVSEDQTKLCFSSGGAATLSDKANMDAGTGWWDSAAMMGHWCQIRVRFTKLPADGLWEMNVKILDLGEHGDAEPAEIYSMNVVEISAKPLYDAPQVLAGFQNLRNDRGFFAMDHFEVAPE